MKTSIQKRVVVTGIGPVTSIGIGKDDFWSKLLNKQKVVQKIPEKFTKNYHFHSKFYIPYPKFSLEDYGFSNKYNSVMEETSKLSVIGTKLALEDAGFHMTGNLPDEPWLIENSAIILGIGICSLKAAFQAYVAHSFCTDKDFLEKNEITARYNRMVIPAIMPNSASSWISVLFNIHGAAYTINASCASGTYSVVEAFRKIRDGYHDLVICGGVECLQDDSGTIMRGFDSLGALTKSENGLPKPFSKDRSGFLFSEGGACILILEEYESAIKRGAEIYAEIDACEFNSDAYNIVQIDPSGSRIKSIFSKLSEGKSIDYINAHGTATFHNDQVEREVIKEVFGDKTTQPLINSTKSILGHSIGSSGAIEVGVTALSVKNSSIHANISENTFEDLNLATENTVGKISYAITTSYGFGGHNVGILLKQHQDKRT